MPDRKKTERNGVQDRVVGTYIDSIMDWTTENSTNIYEESRKLLSLIVI